MSMLKVKDLKVNYGGIEALKGISCDVEQGQIVTLIGANGAGKSTTLQTVSGLLRSKTGSVVFNGKNLGGIPAHKIVSMGIAHVPEGRRIFQQMTVEENIEMGAYTRPGAEYAERVENVFHHFPRLKERRKQIAGTLSGGEQQMLAMGRAMMSNPQLLMLDEPSMGLSPILVDEIFEIIKAFHESGTTILLVEQNANKSLAISDRAYVLENGKVILTGKGYELMQSEEIKKAYLGG